MFANDKNIDNLQQLLAELKKYAELQKDYVKLHLVEKLTILISTLILVFILLILGIIALFYLSFKSRLARKFTIGWTISRLRNKTINRISRIMHPVMIP